VSKNSRLLTKWLAIVVIGVALSVALAATSRSSDDLSPLQTVLRGQSQWLAGGPASLRIIVTNHETGEPVRGAVHVTLSPTDPDLRMAPQRLFTGALDAGTVDASFRVPELPPGAYDLSVRVVSALGIDVIERSISITREAQILLTTDKPLYQPGQTIHLRALALQRPSLQPAAGTGITLEVDDSRGNKVFKRQLQTSDFGVASAEFILADEINFGAYTVRAVMEDGRAERTVNVRRYVLPKFRVNLTTERPYYLPGDRLTGRIQADYFFGKPTSQSEVLITVSTFDTAFHEVAEIRGRTDESGSFRFETDLPTYFVGQPLEQGNAFVKLDVEVTDRADHTERIVHTAPVATAPLIITAVPESGDLKPNIENIVYLLISSPDGNPAAGARVAVSTQPAGEAAAPAVLEGATDQAGIFAARITSPRGGVQMHVDVVDSAGHRVSRDIDLPTDTAAQALILRGDRSIAPVGTSVQFDVISTKQTGTTYVDVIRDNQTVLTRTVDISQGRAHFELPLTHDLSGTLEIHAYQILPDENIIRCTRLLYVEPANDLLVEVRPDQDTYRPGDSASLTFAVRDQQGNPVHAVLGVSIVDESVFALQEMQPGLERVYFALERELLHPRYEIHGFTPQGIVSGRLPFEAPEPAEAEATRQRAAAVLFAAAQPRDPFNLTVNTYQERLAQAMESWVRDIARDAEKINRALQQYHTRHHRYLSPEADISVLVEEGLLYRNDLRDRWGNPYRVRWRQAECSLNSAGPDGQWRTSDDISNITRWPREGLVGRFFGRGGGVVALDAMMAMEKGVAAPMAAAESEVAQGAASAEAPGQPQVRLRQFFPETMYVNPAIITDQRGEATVTVDMADSITTWRLSALASSQRGQLGSTSSGLRVFQDFFIDIDLPVALTQNDEVSIPIAVYNYLPEPQTINLALETQPWFELVDDEAEKSLDIAASDIRVVYYRLRTTGIGVHRLTVRARGSRLSDAIRREIEVLPDGEEQRDTWNDRLEGTVERTVTLPQQAIPDASTILVKIYPGLFSQAVEGLDSLLRMPFGCFEQTSSVTYPNVLVLDYFRSTNQANPEIQMKAEQHINVGYQRLLSFEVDGGGFSWFGQPPAHKVLTAYGLLLFRDMSRVHEVDENVITRTQRWLAGLQRQDGSWERDEGGIAEGVINRQTDTVRVTAYITWTLAESGYQGEEISLGLRYLDAHWREVDDPYTLAVIANAYLSGAPDSANATRVVDALAGLAIADESAAYWQAQAPTFTSAQDGSADLETTALATYALVKSERHVGLTNKAITYLIRSKDSFGTWQTTQATVWSLKALLLSLHRATEQIDATVTVEVNGEQAGSFRITQDDYDVVRQVDARELVRAGANDVRVAITGEGSALYQIVAKYYLPWEMVRPPAQELLTIDVDYDRTTLSTDDIVTASVRVVNQDPRDCNMVVIDLGVPPGFQVLAEDLQSLVDEGTIQKYTIAARQIIIYLDRLASREPLDISYRLRANFPMRAATPSSRVYRYYNPEIEATAEPVTIEVR